VTRRLLVVTQTHNLWGGIESWMADLFSGMASAGWEVEYALALGARYNIPGEFVRNHNYIQSYHVLDGRAGTPHSRQRAILQVLERLKPDLVMPVAIGDVLPALRQFRYQGGRTRIVISVHSPHAGSLADIVDNADIIDAVGVVSGLIYQWAVEAFAMMPMKVFLIRYGVAEPVKAGPRKHCELLRVGYIGRLESEIHKRALDLVPILKSLRDLEQRICLRIVGDGPSARELVAGTAQCGNFHDVRMLGFLNRERIYREIYPELDCILMTSEHEGSPLVLIEAMRHGIVPVSSRFVGHASEGLLAPEQNCLTFPIGDTSAAADSLRRLAQDRSLLERLAVAAKLSSGKYNRDEMVRGWMAACLSALETEPRKPSKEHLAPRSTYGRLERIGLPPMVIGAIRNARRKWFKHGSGFEEWPGSLSADRDLENRIANRLIAIESARSAALYQAN
jgi:glycosyltransferase involved in cell wall biosynthesis